MIMKNVVKYGKIVRNLYTITSAIHSRVSHKHLKGGAGGGGGALLPIGVGTWCRRWGSN